MVVIGCRQRCCHHRHHPVCHCERPENCPNWLKEETLLNFPVSTSPLTEYIGLFSYNYVSMVLGGDEWVLHILCSLVLGSLTVSSIPVTKLN